MPHDSRSIRLDGRVALITGAAAGIGRAVAATLAGGGAHLALCDRDEAGLEQAAVDARGAGASVVTGVLDVRDVELRERFVSRAARALGRIDVLVNNAGGGFAAPFADLTAGAEHALIEENFTSVTGFIRAVLPHVPAEGGSIINLTSIEAHRAAPGYATYAAMKAAVANLTRSLALELGGRGIRVNAIAPDMILTPGIGDPGLRVPLGRPGHVDDVAGVALFLASELSAYVTGTTIHVDGGAWAAGGWRVCSGGGFEL